MLPAGRFQIALRTCTLISRFDLPLASASVSVRFFWAFTPRTAASDELAAVTEQKATSLCSSAGLFDILAVHTQVKTRRSQLTLQSVLLQQSMTQDTGALLTCENLQRTKLLLLAAFGGGSPVFIICV